MRRLGFMLAVAALAAASHAGGPASARDSVPDASTGTPLSPDEIFRLYQGRSWMWSQGAGYFSAKANRFTAWSGADGAVSHAEGHWFATAAGKLCFRATWRAQSGSSRNLTCFSHRKLGGVVFQKREPDGEWYVFRGNTGAADEYLKLRPGNYVKARQPGYR